MAKKQIPLRIGEKLYNALASWAEDDFRSLNGQIEYLLTECVKQRKKDGKYVGESIDEPIELDIDQPHCFHFGEITSENQAIYISHRLSSCIFCDVVAVMENGQIVQIGTHEKLLEDSGGVYSTLWNAQAKHYKNQPKEAENILC